MSTWLDYATSSGETGGRWFLREQLVKNALGIGRGSHILHQQRHSPDRQHDHDHDHDHAHAHDHDHDEEGRCLPGDRSDSVATYDRYGVRFRYPSDWTLTEEAGNDETTITLQSDGTSFWTLMLFSTRPDPDQVLETVAAAFEQDYEDVDVAAAVDSISGLPSLGRDLDFVCYDLVNSAIVRAFQTSDNTVMILYQGTDHELETTRAQLRAITDSLICDDEDGEPLDDEE